MTTLQVPQDTPPSWVKELIVIAREQSRAAIHLDATDATELVASTLAAVAPATDLSSSVALGVAIGVAWTAHLAGTAQHTAADATNTVGAAAVTDLATLETWIIEFKADFNAHIKDASLTWHRNRAWDLITSGDPSTDQAAANLITNEARTKLVNHIRDGAKTLPASSAIGG